MFSDDYESDVAAVVNQYQPDLVGLSLRNLDNGSYLDPQWALPVTKRVTDILRSITQATIVCGGPAFSILPGSVSLLFSRTWALWATPGRPLLN